MLSKLSIASEDLTVDCEFSYVYKVLAVQELLFLLLFSHCLRVLMSLYCELFQPRHINLHLLQEQQKFAG